MTHTLSVVGSPLTEPLLRKQVVLANTQVLSATSVDDNSRRMLAGEFDIAEMSLATFVGAACRGSDLIGLPLFPGRRFVHAGMLVHRDAGISDPRKLAGRRVAVPQYWLTSSIWLRGLLHDEYGVDARDIEWVTISPERGDVPTPPVRTMRIDGTSIAELFAQRHVDAALVPREPSSELVKAGAITLLPDPKAQQKNYFQRTGVVPLLHFIAMRRRLAVAQPGLVAAVRDAFEHCAQTPRDVQTDASVDLSRSIGLEANRPALERFLTYAHEQGLMPDLPALETLFVRDPLNQRAFA